MTGHDLTPKSKVKTLVAQLVLLGIVIMTIGVGLGIVAMVWPYDDVRYGSAESEVLNPDETVQQGGVLITTNPSFCVDNQDVTIERWADRLDKDGNILASFQMFTIVFRGAGLGLKCYIPSLNKLTLPNYVVSADGTKAHFRLRQYLSYHPNFLRTVTLQTSSTDFIVVPNPIVRVNPTK